MDEKQFLKELPHIEGGGKLIEVTDDNFEEHLDNLWGHMNLIKLTSSMLLGKRIPIWKYTVYKKSHEVKGVRIDELDRLLEWYKHLHKVNTIPDGWDDLKQFQIYSGLKLIEL